MTRINLLDPSELSDQHLIAEYRELPRCIKQDISIKDAPSSYVLGKGHMKWARKNWKYLLDRYKDICKELVYRGFNIKYTSEELTNYFQKNFPHMRQESFVPTEEELNISRNRIILKLKQKPWFYKWTNRKQPTYK